MVKARYIVSDEVTDVGLRVFITSHMIENGFKKGIPKNISDKEIEVLIDLEDKNPETFRKELENAIHTKFKGVKEPEKIKVELKETSSNANPIGEIPDIMLSSQMLQLDQMSKFINIGSQMSKDMKEGFKSMGKQMKEGFNSMGKQIKDGFGILAKAFKSK